MHVILSLFFLLKVIYGMGNLFHLFEHSDLLVVAVGSVILIRFWGLFQAVID